MRSSAKLLSIALLSLPLAVFAAPDDSFDGRAKKPLVPEASQAPAAHGSAVNADPRLWIVAEASSVETRTQIIDAGVSIEEVSGGKSSGIGTPRSAQRLRRLGIRFTSIPLIERFHAEDFPSKDAAFHNYERMVSEIKAIASDASDLASVFSIGKSLQGRDLWALRLNSSASGSGLSSKPGALFLGTHHAREHLSTEVPLLLARYLVENRNKPEIAKLLATRDIYFLPMVNPDGVEYDIEGGSYHMQRKNMRSNGDGSTGVDLNRNYGYHWGGSGASADPESETYRGPSAFSEPETQAVKAFIDGRKDTLKIILSYHSFSELILYPWGHSTEQIPDAKALAAYTAMGSEMSSMTGYKAGQVSRILYTASGDTVDWAWGTHKIFAFTFELTPKSMWDGGFYPGAGAIESTFRNNIRPALYLLNLADNPLRAADTPLSRAPSIPTTGGR